MNTLGRTSEFQSIIDQDLAYIKAKGKLYKYISSSSGILMLENLGIKFNIPKNFNDPFDCDPSLIATSNRYNLELLKSILENPPRDLAKQVKEAIQKVVKEGDFNNSRYYAGFKETSREDLRHQLLVNTKITCFSEENDNMLMWSHYTKNQCHKDHTGMCVEFQVEPFLESMVKTLNSMGLEGQFLKVKYDENRINYVVDSAKDLSPMMMWFKTKSICWAYEKEIRFLLPKWVQDLDRSILPISNEVISAVYLGVNISLDDENRIKELCRRKLPFTKLFKMQLSEDHYALRPKKI